MRTVYYNEINKHAAETLRELMAEKLIPQGVVDERSIDEVQPGDLQGFNQCHFFAGIGGWPFALRLAGIPDDWPLWTGSCPCQSFSVAGVQRGFADPRHLWPKWFELIRSCKPPLVFGEQVEAAVRVGDDRESWLELVERNLASRGYAFGAAVFPASYVGAPHKRERLYFVADSCRVGPQPQRQPVRGRMDGSFWSGAEWVLCPDGKRRSVKPGVGALAHGLPGGMDAVRGAGNAIVPQQAAEFVEAYFEARWQKQGAIFVAA